MQKIISVDFDGTLFKGAWPETYKGKPNIRLIQYLVKARKQGYALILDTMREGQLLDEAVMRCMDFGLVFDAINDSLPEQIEFWGCNPRKIYADYRIDDCNALCGIGKKLPVLKRKK